MAASSTRLLMNVDFPVFVIKAISPRHFVVCGGGGPSATGVRNGLDVIEIECDDKNGLQAKSVCKHDIDKYAIMNCGAVVDNLKRVHLACGHDDKCCIYVIKQKTVTPRPNSPDGQLRKRKSGLTQADDFKNAKKITTFDVQLVDSMRTDFHKDDAYQNCAAFLPDTSRLCTAGADGHIRAWKYPELTKSWEIKAHEHEVDTLAVDPSGNQICSTSSKDRKLMLWSAEDGSELAELKWVKEPSIKYKHKACKYCYIDRDPSKACLFTIEVPVAHKKGAPCYISQWNINKYMPIYVHAVYVGTLSCMDISDCGNYLAVGTMEGNVEVFDTNNFKSLYSAQQAHKTFVTDLAFSPTTYGGKIITRDQRFTLLSISIDNQVKLHQPKTKKWRSYRLFVWLFFLFLMVLFTFLFGVDLSALKSALIE